MCLGIAAAWPAVYLISSLVVVPLLKPLGIVSSTPPDPLPWWFIGLLGLHAGTILLGVAVLFVCLTYLFRAARLDGYKTALWVVLLLLGSIVTAPLFVWWHVSPERRASVSPGQ